METKEMNVKCGESTDSFEKLETLCEKEAQKLAGTLEIPEQTTISVAFWTNGRSELIGTADFYKDGTGNVCYDLDFSETTL